jgi:uncharacterized protein YutE (UPF0331/DUF86 family)
VSPDHLDARVVAAKLEIVAKMLSGIEALPLTSFGDFVADPRNVGAGESYLRRALEALLDLGRHLLAKGFGQPVSEYAEIGDALGRRGVLSRDDAMLLRRMAGYRNRLVHLYDEIADVELHRMLTVHVADVSRIAAALRSWIASHPDRVAGSL